MSNKDKDLGALLSFLETVKDVSELHEDKGKRSYTPISPHDFFTSMYYSGFSKDDIYPFWINEAIDFIEGGYNELIITGSLGSGKTTVANLITMYKLYELFSYESVNDYLGIPRMQDIYNIYFSVSRFQAMRTGFGQFRSMVDSSKWFQEHFPRNPRIGAVLEFLKGKFSFFSGSSHKHAIGMTVWSFVLDEADFYKKNGGFDESYNSITEMYGELVDRRISRFKKFGKDFSFSILVSSASYQSSFVEKRIAASAEDPTIKIISAVTYKIKPKGTYSVDKFLVFIGSEMVDPDLIKENSQLDALAKQLKYEFSSSDSLTVIENYMLLPQEMKPLFELVPMDFKEAFDRDLHKSLMNHCGVFTARIGKLLKSRSILLDAYTNEVGHPFTKKSIEISTGDEVEIKDFFLPTLLEYVERPHAIHIDQSISTDHTGISMVRYDGMGKKGDLLVRQYTQVFTLEVVPPAPPYKIKIAKTRNFIIFLSEKCNVNIVKVTADGYQSDDALQILADHGLDTGRQSIDKTDKPFLSWINALHDGGMRMYRLEALENEAFTLVHDRRKKKVLKAVGQSDDLTQSLVGALQNLVSMDDLYGAETEEVMEMLAKKIQERANEDPNNLLTKGKEVDDYIGEIRRSNLRENAFKAIL